MAIVYGQDTSCVSDIGYTDVQVTNPRLLIAQRIARILQTPRGAFAIIGDDGSVGYDTRALINAKLGPTELAKAKADIEAECLKDEQVNDATATLTLNAQSSTLTISISLTSSDGPFSLVLAVGDVTTDILFSFQDGSQ